MAKQINIKKRKRIDITIRNLINNPMKNPEIREKLSKTQKERYRKQLKLGIIKGSFIKGEKRCIEYGKANSKYLKEYDKIHPHHMLGKKHKPESIEKMKQSHKGAKPWNKGKKGLQVAWNKGIPASPEQKERMKEMRLKVIVPKQDTKPEQKMKSMLQNLNIDFKQHKVMPLKKPYQCDFFIPSKNLVIECDGNYWHHYPFGLERDVERNKELRQQGFKVWRFWENEIKLMNLEDLNNKFIGRTP